MATKTRTRWQTCKEPTDHSQWNCPPRRDGQIVLVHYAAGDDGVIYRRTWDQSDGSRSYEKRLLAEGEGFEPWQTEPN